MTHGLRLLVVNPNTTRSMTEAIGRAAAAVAAPGTRIALKTSHRAYVLRTGEIALEGESKDLAKNAEIQAAYLGG